MPVTAMQEPPPLPYPRVHRGKVRDLFDLGGHYLIVASDRVSAFDVVLPDGIPGKGILLTQISLAWFARTAALARNHLVDDHDAALRQALGKHADLAPRSMLVRKITPLKIEAVVRGYLSGSAWNAYRRTGKLWEHDLPIDLVESARLPEPLFTPTTKADVGGKDLPMTAEAGRALLGVDRFEAVRDLSLRLYAYGAREAAKVGLILADTKFEFGEDDDGDLVLIDEVLTPDSSRYWPAERYEPGRPQPSFDKQFVRDYLESLDWDKIPPGPELPPDIIERTRDKYWQALEALVSTQR